MDLNSSNESKICTVDLEYIVNHTNHQKKRWTKFLQMLENKSMVADEEDNLFAVDVDDHDCSKRSTSTTDEMVCFIEESLKSNLKELYYERMKGKLFYNEDEFEKISDETTKEVKRLLQYVRKRELYVYLDYCTKIDKAIPNKIEKKFGKIFRDCLLSRRSALGELRIDLNILLHQWNEVAATFSEEEVVQYCIYVFQSPLDILPND